MKNIIPVYYYHLTAHQHLVKFAKSKSFFFYSLITLNLYCVISTFGLAYEEAAEKTGARVSFDSFEASIVQVHDGDIEHFVETLYYKTR